MSLLKKLQIGNNALGKYTTEYLLKDYKCHTCREHNEFRPSADKYCERIDLMVVAPGRENVHLYNWFINQSAETGRILIELPPNSDREVEKRKEVRFENAIIYSLEEEFHFNTDRVRTLKVSIVAETVTIDGVNFNQN